MRLGDLDALRKNMEFVCMGIMAGTEPYNAPLTEIDKAPTVDVDKELERQREELYEESKKLYMLAKTLGKEERPQGEWVRKEDLIHYIATQYSEHNELVPVWLNIGDLKGGAE